MSEYNFGWGNPVCVGQALSSLYDLNKFTLNLSDLAYPDPSGLPNLVLKTKQFIKQEYLRDYKYLTITNGAQQALNVALRVYNDSGYNLIHYERPFFSAYTNIAKKNKYSVIDTKNTVQYTNNFIDLITSPNNPDGKILAPTKHTNQIIWDGIYASRVYSGFYPIFDHKMFIGSFGKTFGVPGLRLGWIATNDQDLHNSISSEMFTETFGISTPSQMLASDILSKVDFDLFSMKASNNIDDNKTEMAALEKYSNICIPPVGMFYWMEVDNSFKKRLDKIGVQYMDGLTFGGTSNNIRLNMAQDRTLTKKMIKNLFKML